MRTRKNINGNTKQAQRLIENYLSSSAIKLNEIYKNPSNNKRKITCDLMYKLELFNGKQERFINGNTFNFSFAFLTRIKDNTNVCGYTHYLMYYTKDYIYYIKLTREQYNMLYDLQLEQQLNLITKDLMI